MKHNLERLIAYLSSNPDVSPIDLSYTTTARRRHHALRLTVTGTTTDQIRSALEQKRQKVPSEFPFSQKKTLALFVFTGQGAAYPALAHELYTSSIQFRTDIDHFEEIATQQGFPSFLPVLEGITTDLSTLSPIQVQMGLMCIQIALARLWDSWGVRPKVVIGHSLGEYAALQVSGVLSISDAIFLVGYRARLLENLCEMHTHAMLAVNQPPSILEAVPSTISSHVEIACLNSPMDTVFAAEQDIIDQLQAHLSARNVLCTKLQLPYAFHSQQVVPILDKLEEAASSVGMAATQITLISSLAGKPWLLPIVSMLLICGNIVGSRWPSPPHLKMLGMMALLTILLSALRSDHIRYAPA